ncbi:MAG: LapA family protein [Oceanospirillaceae bacterium]
MRWLKMLLVLIICILVLLVGVLFTIHNTDKVAIDLIFVQLPQASLSLWLIAFFVAGGILGTILSTFAILGLKTKLNISRRKEQAVSKELAACRA